MTAERELGPRTAARAGAAGRVRLGIEKYVRDALRTFDGGAGVSRNGERKVLVEARRDPLEFTSREPRHH